MPYVQSDFDKGKIRFGGPSKFISQLLKIKREKDPYDLIGLTQSMFTTIGELGLLEFDFNDRYAVGESGETDFRPVGSTSALPFMATTAKEAATALTLASSKDNPVDAIRAVETFLDSVAAVNKTKAGKRKKSLKNAEDKGAWISGIACLDGQLRNPASLDLKKYEDIFDLFAGQTEHGENWQRRKSLCDLGYSAHFDYLGDSAERAVASMLKYV